MQCLKRPEDGDSSSESDVLAMLARVQAIYPGTNICCVMAPTGNVL